MIVPRGRVCPMRRGVLFSRHDHPVLALGQAPEGSTQHGQPLALLARVSASRPGAGKASQTYRSVRAGRSGPPLSSLVTPLDPHGRSRGRGEQAAQPPVRVNSQAALTVSK